MVSYVAHNRKGPATGGCGCGGARAPVPIPLPPLEQITLPVINNTRISDEEKKQEVKYLPNFPKIGQIVQSANLDLMKQSKITEKTVPVAIKPSTTKVEVPSEITNIDLRNVVSLYNSRGVSRENSFNKMNLPRRGCCGSRN